MTVNRSNQSLSIDWLSTKMMAWPDDDDDDGGDDDGGGDGAGVLVPRRTHAVDIPIPLLMWRGLDLWSPRRRQFDSSLMTRPAEGYPSLSKSHIIMELIAAR